PSSEHRRERPPHALDVIVRVGDVRVAVVQPIADALTQLLPVGAIAPDTFAAHFVEALDTNLLDLLLCRANSEIGLDSFLDFDFDRKAVRVPASFARHVIATHRTVPAEEILHRP